MDILRDHQHEGWVLAAYPDPNTRRPLIGAGFSLDVAGDGSLAARSTESVHLCGTFRRAAVAGGGSGSRTVTAYPRPVRPQCSYLVAEGPIAERLSVIRSRGQLTDEEATRLLRISAIQAIYNARAYCRGFDRLTASQQMALSQLVFQMGTNLGGFVQFLDAVNDEDNAHELAKLDGYLETYTEHWQRVQNTLIDSQWAPAILGARHDGHCHVRSGIQRGARESAAAGGGRPSCETSFNRYHSKPPVTTNTPRKSHNKKRA